MNLSWWAAGAGIFGACLGAFSAGGGRWRLLIPFSGAVLLAVSLFSILPEIAEELGWGRTLGLYALGFGALTAVDRLVYPVCPSCSHGGEGHRHWQGGFGIPLALAASMHAFLDGWSLAAARQFGNGPLRTAIPVAILIHKVPEGLALGVMLRMAFGRRGRAMLLGSAAEACTLGGAAAGAGVFSQAGTGWASCLLAVAGGTFLYLGAHAVAVLFRNRDGAW